MEGALEMDDFGAAFAATGGQVLAHLPIHRGLERVLDRERAALDEEVSVQRRQTDDAPERLHETRVTFRVNVRVGDLDLGRAQQVCLHLGPIKMGMIESDRVGAEEAVKIDHASLVGRVVEIGAVAFLEIDDDAKAVEEDVLGDLIEDPGLRGSLWALAGAAWRGCAGRLREHGWHTHPLTVAGAKMLVNRSGLMAGLTLPSPTRCLLSDRRASRPLVPASGRSLRDRRFQKRRRNAC